MSNLALADRHPSTQEKARWLEADPRLPAGPPSGVAQFFAWARDQLLDLIGDGPQGTIALQHLIDAKDAAVRQAITDFDGPGR